ncbi:YcnI family protein [Chthonobacter rhizosphaerae]|uniref:YcnI family copper-binding membrane protein n=1 Tax=Chthonobacter rhizosphaerae TaxID=2735553 RepID=UPI0015EE9A54|nr:DUF1775 domain-containing protein [Chthonobacter rhizosphaerae]
MRYSLSAAVAALLACAAPSAAHVSLEVKEAKAGSAYKAVLRVPHGCDGEATLRVRVRVPDGLYSVKPMPKAGWTLETVTGPYAQPFDNHGTTVTEGVREIVWTGELQDAHYDEFVFRGSLARGLAAGSFLAIPVVQECANGAERWIQVPAEGQSADDLERPAPMLRILPASGGH